jgi:nucleoside 2-deoxyribosyltransferase
MVSFISKRLQVFVSSTYTDLIHERQAAVEAILIAGHIPAGMELFTSGDESQMEVINQWIDESDIYLLILGGRYGSVEPKTEKSYTQLEYDYAVKKGKPLFACVMKKSVLESRVNIHGTGIMETVNPQKLKDFRAVVITKTSRFWEDSKDIKIAVGETLSNFSRRDELIGWIRANQEADMPALAYEIARLSKENAQLRDQILKRETTETLIHGLSFDQLKAILKNKGLLEVFDKIRPQLVDPSGMFATEESESSALRELCLLGLLMTQRRDSTNLGSLSFPGPTRYRLTEAGYVFLNKLELHKLETLAIE